MQVPHIVSLRQPFSLDLSIPTFKKLQQDTAASLTPHHHPMIKAIWPHLQTYLGWYFIRGVIMSKLLSTVAEMSHMAGLGNANRPQQTQGESLIMEEFQSLCNLKQPVVDL